MTRIWKFIYGNGFIFGLLLTVGLAWIFPDFGASGGIFQPAWSTKLAVFIIFFNQGLALPLEELKNDLLEWRLHLFIQSFTFIVIPVIVLLFIWLAGDFLPADLRFGFFYLAILPTTISTAVIFSTQAGGNAAGAIFNVSLSNTLGVFIVPAATAWWLSASAGQSIPVLPLLGKIALLLLLPMLIGQIARIWLKNWVSGKKKLMKRINTGLIFFILYAAFCNSIKGGIWEHYGVFLVVKALVISLMLLVIIKMLVLTALRPMPFGHASRMTAFFCASQKTLAAGVPMATSIFGGLQGMDKVPELGIVLIPIMCYHFLQLLIGGFLINYFQKN